MAKAWNKSQGEISSSKTASKAKRLPYSKAPPLDSDSFKLQMENDEFVVSIREKLDTDSKLSFDLSLLNEVETYFQFSVTEKSGAERRPVPSHFDSEKDLEELSKHFEACQAYKDRTVKILLGATRLKKQLERMWKISKAYAYDRYSHLFQTLRSEEQRTAMCNRVFPELVERLDNVELLVEMSDMVLSNLSSSHFALREVKEVGIRVLEALIKRRTSV